jgi:oleate hydratase
VLPLVKWLLDHGVMFHYGTEVTDVDFTIAPGRRRPASTGAGRRGGVDLGPDDLCS